MLGMEQLYFPMFEEALEIEDYQLVEPYIRISEQAESKKLANAHVESIAADATAPAGLTPEDYSNTSPVQGGELNLG